MKTTLQSKSSGFALLAVLILVVVLSSMFSAYMVLTRTELGLVKTSRDSASGFNAAEAGLNLRAEAIRGIFLDFDFPEGTSPTSVSDCDSGSVGSGDYQCQTYDFDNSHSAVTYIEEEPGNPIFTTVPPGEPFAGLSAQEYRYTVTSVGRNNQQSNEAVLDLTFKSRLVPMFQFAIFFNEDLEFFNGAQMSINGPVHTNGDIYLAPQDGGQTDYTGQITVAGTFFRGMKSQPDCSGYTGTARVQDPANYLDLPSCASSRRVVDDVEAWNENIVLGLDKVSVPEPDDFDPFSNKEYWKRADLRLVLYLNSSGTPNTTYSSTGVRVVDVSGANISAATNALHSSSGCPGLIRTGSSGPLLAVGTQGPGTSGNQLRQYREYQYNASLNNYQRTLEVDMRALLNCIHSNPVILGGKSLDDDTEQGLVFHFTISGPLSNVSHNNYTVRIRNAAQLQATYSSAADVRGMTVVSDQALTVWGNYNSTNWIPAALMSDTLYLLSNSWTDSDSYLTDRYDRDGNATAVYAAVLSGIKRTGGANGPAGQDHGADTNGGGVINVFRFNEWFRVGSTAIPDFTYVGSIVSLGAPRRSQSSWGPFTYYSAPNRVWSYDTRFNDPDKLPPMTPAFTYLRQELFVRNYEL